LSRSRPPKWLARTLAPRRHQIPYMHHSKLLCINNLHIRKWAQKRRPLAPIVLNFKADRMRVVIRRPRRRFMDDWIPGHQLLINVRRQKNRSAGRVHLGRNQCVFYYENLLSVWSAPGQPWRKGRDPIQRDWSEGRRRSMLRAASEANTG
jgi:hypothetical protein